MGIGKPVGRKTKERDDVLVKRRGERRIGCLSPIYTGAAKNKIRWLG